MDLTSSHAAASRTEPAGRKSNEMPQLPRQQRAPVEKAATARQELARLTG